MCHVWRWLELVSTYEYLDIYRISTWVGNSLTAYLSFTVIYTTKDNSGNMSWQLNHVVTQPRSDSVITFFWGETALSRVGLCWIYNQLTCNKQHRHQRQTNKRVSFGHHLYSNNAASFPHFFSQIIRPVLWGGWLLNRCRSISEFNKNKQSLSPLCPLSGSQEVRCSLHHHITRYLIIRAACASQWALQFLQRHLIGPT